jgi:DNA-binding PadR family transcriptional regulator
MIAAMAVPVKLFVLGLLAQKERHGYEIAATAKSWGIGDWAGFGLGSLYHALAALEKAGDIKTRRTERRGKYPSRSVYAITRKGRDTVGQLLVEASQDARLEDPIDLVLGFLPLLPAAERRPLLELRVNLLVDATNDMSEKAHQLRKRGADPWALASLDRWVIMGQAQAQWLRSLMDQVEQWSLT